MKSTDFPATVGPRSSCPSGAIGRYTGGRGARPMDEGVVVKGQAAFVYSVCMARER